MISDVVEPVPAPDAVSALEQLLGRDVHLLVDPAVVLVHRHVVALLARDRLVLPHLVAARPTVEIHLPKYLSLSQKYISLSQKYIDNNT